MSIRIMSAVWDSSPYEHSLLLVHLCLADIANDEGYCWPAVSSIAKKCRLDERYTRKLLSQMVEDGVVERALNEGKRGTNVYLVRVTPVEKDRGVKKTGGQNRQVGEKDTLSPETPPPLSPRTPEPSVEPSSSSSSTKTKKDHADELKALEGQLRELGLLDLWKELQVVRRKKKASTPFSDVLILRKLLEHPRHIRRGMEKAIESGWRGFEWEWVDKSLPKKRQPTKPTPAKKDDFDPSAVGPMPGWMEFLERGRKERERTEHEYEEIPQ